MESWCPLKSLVGNSVLEIINWDSEERKEKEEKVMLWRLSGRTVGGTPEGNPAVIHCVVHRGWGKIPI